MNKRFELALEQISAEDWRAFEKLAATFLSAEYPNYRTSASPSGDSGCDGFLYDPDGDRTTVVQMSVTQKWQEKILSTVKLVSTNFPAVVELIYVTNRRIGAAGDKIAHRCRTEFNIRLDIRDGSWFVERAESSPERSAAAEEASIEFVDPLLGRRGIIESKPLAISKDEAEIALLHLSLADIDDAGNKGLTKQCFEALVMSTLHDSSFENALTFDGILSEIRALLPGEHGVKVESETRSAVTRLSRRGGAIKKQGKTGALYLAQEKRTELADHVAAFLSDESTLDKELVEALSRTGIDISKVPDEKALCKALRECMDSLLYAKGERFASSVVSGNIKRTDVSDTLIGWVPSAAFPEVEAAHVRSALVTVLCTPTESTHRHIQKISDAYTLFAFLRQTPDVQRTVVKIFSDGELWLDTNIIIPMLGESLEVDELAMPYTTTLRAASAAGLRLFVTDGVIEEVERHINRSRAYAYSTSKWNGSVPGLVGRYISSGMKRESFNSWSETFCGLSRPLDDIKEYLADEYSIRVRNLAGEAEKADIALRGAVQEYWFKIHEDRGRRQNRDPEIIAKLVKHDVENVVGIIQLRRNQTPTPLGFREWWLTDDGAAAPLSNVLKSQLAGNVPRSPAIDPAFLSQLIRVGPMRAAVDKDLKVHLPVIIDFSRMNVTPPALVDEAGRIRDEAAGVNERVLKRRIRDKLDSMREYTTPATVKVGFDELRDSEGRSGDLDIDAHLLIGDIDI